MPSLERPAARLPPDRFAVVAVRTRDKIAFDTNSGPLSLRRKGGRVMASGGQPCLQEANPGLDINAGVMVELGRAQASLPHRIWCRNPQRQTVTRPKGQHFQWLSSAKSLGSK